MALVFRGLGLVVFCLGWSGLGPIGIGFRSGFSSLLLSFRIELLLSELGRCMFES